MDLDLFSLEVGAALAAAVALVLLCGSFVVYRHHRASAKLRETVDVPAGWEEAAPSATDSAVDELAASKVVV
jgi:hypothetical protein